MIGNDAAVAFGGAAGNFELNVMLPVMARNLLESIRLLANVVAAVRRPLRRRHRRQRRARAASYAESSPSIVTPLNRYIGYEEAAKVAKQALGRAARRSARSSIERGYVERRQAHRGAARRGARRAGDDAPAGLSAPPRRCRPVSEPASPLLHRDGSATTSAPYHYETIRKPAATVFTCALILAGRAPAR